MARQKVFDGAVGAPNRWSWLLAIVIGLLFLHATGGVEDSGDVFGNIGCAIQRGVDSYNAADDGYRGPPAESPDGRC